MKKHFVLISILLILITGCSSTPDIVDNGNPGQITVFVFIDSDRNGVKGADEAGQPGQVGISQDNSCPPGEDDKFILVNTDENGIANFANLAPGKYCVSMIDTVPLTSQQNVTVYLSSDQNVQVFYGISE